MTKSKITAFISLFLLSFLLTACTVQDIPLIGPLLSRTGKTVLSGPADLTMWGMWESPEIMQELIDQYQEEHPNVTINYEDRSVIKPLSDYKDRVFSRLGEDDGPDIAQVHVGWVPGLSPLLSPMPSGIMDVATYSQSFYPVASEMMVLNNRIYGIPTYYDGLLLVYNKEHFREIDQQEPPTAWEEFRRLALELTVRGSERGKSIVRAGAALGSASNVEHFADILGLMWSQAGVSLPLGIDTEAAQHALLFYTNFVKEDGVWSEDFPEATAAFAGGQVSMIFVPSWRILDILAMAPNMEIGVAPVPQALPQQPASWASFWVGVVSTKSSNPKAAWEFLAFLADEEQQLMTFNEASNYRYFGAAFSRVSMASELELNEYLQPLLEMAPYAKTAEIASRAGNKKQEDALYEAVESVLDGTSAEEALVRAKGVIMK